MSESKVFYWDITMIHDFETQRQATFDKQPKEAMHHFLGEVNDYIDFVNKISELLRLSEGIGTEPLDKDITIGDVMLSLMRKGEKLRTNAEILHDYASQLDE